MQRLLPPLAALLLLAAPSPGAAQSATAVERDRADYVRWLDSAPDSPLAAVAHQPLGPGLELGPAGSDLPLEGLPRHRLVERGAALELEGPDGSRRVPRHRPVPLGPWVLTVSGPPGQAVLTVFDPRRRGPAPCHYPYQPAYLFEGPLAPPAEPGTSRVLGLDGIEVEAAEAGSVAVPLPGGTHRLRVLRMPVPGTDESELEIFFRDATSGAGTYPAGRFVPLIPLGGGRYRLDFNRARNPFCAYNTVYPCPLPWRGNTLPVPIEAGERYHGGADSTAGPAG